MPLTWSRAPEGQRLSLLYDQTAHFGSYTVRQVTNIDGVVNPADPSLVRLTASTEYFQSAREMIVDSAGTTKKYTYTADEGLRIELGAMPITGRARNQTGLTRVEWEKSGAAAQAATVSITGYDRTNGLPLGYGGRDCTLALSGIAWPSTVLKVRVVKP